MSLALSALHIINAFSWDGLKIPKFYCVGENSSGSSIL